MENVSERILNLTPEKLALLLRKVEQTVQEETPAIQELIARQPRRDGLNTFPLSLAQTRLWFLNQLVPDNVAYNLTSVLRLTGVVDPEVLERCLNEVVRRHETLRTVFDEVDGQPLQVVRPATPLRLPVVDLSHLAPEEQSRHIRQRVAAQNSQAFNLAQGPLLRMQLIRLATEEYLSVQTMHHLVADGWSAQVLIRELVELYEAHVSGRAASLAELPIQYGDFAAWQRAWLQGERLATQLDYWKKQLAGAPTLLTLPISRPRPSVQTFSGAAHTFTLSSDLVRQLQAIGQTENATLFMTLLAVFKVLLYRYTGQTDILVGAPIAGRHRAELERLIGFFVNTLALRTDLAGNPTFRQLLRRVHTVALEAYAHQDLPFEKLVEEIQPERDLSYHPLVQIVFDLQNLPAAPLSSSQLTLSPVEVETEQVQFDVALSLVETPEGLQGAFKYNTNLFDGGAIARLAGHFVTLAAAVVVNPDDGIAQLPLLAAAERQQLLAHWNDTAVPFSPEHYAHQLVEIAAGRTPWATAAVQGELRLTFGELNSRANQLAHYLQKRGVGPESRVAICLERSLDLIVGVLGILKAGGAYVPLDPAYPPERLAFLIKDAQAPVVLARAGLGPLLPEPERTVVYLDQERPAIALESTENPASLVGGDNLAYVIYTSGSTGQPKGVEIPHQGLLNLIFWHRRAFNVTENDRATLLSGLGFDASVWELWPYLAAGASIHVPDEETRLSAGALQQWLLEEEITICFAPTPLAEILLELPWPAETRLRILLTGGDRLHGYPAEDRPFTLINNYGPTETTVVATSGAVKPGVGAGAALPAIGRPIDNTDLYVLDAYLQPQPTGVAGELYIGGAGVARGYLGQPGQTAAKFIPHPFSAQPGARLYRTGDIVRYLPTGELEFLGRGDDQVKIRGFRIELGEIEATLKAHPAVREATVAIHGDTALDKRLVAYAVIDESQEEPEQHLRHYLLERLPRFMVPTAFVFLPALPLTVNGKVDRAALPLPERREPGQTHEAPGTPLETALAHIWADLLHLEAVDVHHHFFESGGHSLLATQIVTQLREREGITLPLRAIFEAPTIRELAEWITVMQGQPEPGALLSPAQRRFWFLDRFEAERAAYQVARAVRLRGPLELLRLETAIRESVKRHSILRTFFIAADGEPVAVVRPELPFSLLVLDVRDLPDEVQAARVQAAMRQECQQPFDLAEGPLWRIRLFHLNENDYILFLAMHQIVADESSLALFVAEIFRLYRDTFGAKGAPQPAGQYADYAARQIEWLRSQEGTAHLAYWKSQLAALPPSLALPTAYPRPGMQSFAGAAHSFTVSEEVAERLKPIGHQEEASLPTTLLAAFKALLYRYSGQEDLAIGLATTNRHTPEVTRLIGPVSDWLVIRTQLSSRVSFFEFLRQVQATVTAARAHGDAPLATLVEEIQTKRDLSLPPLVQVAFAWQESLAGWPSLPGLSLTPLEVDHQIAHFDLFLSLRESRAGLQGTVIYNAALFTTETIATLARHYQTLLINMVANPDLPVGRLPLLSEEERHRLLVAWNDRYSGPDIGQGTGAEAFTPQATIHLLFEQQVARTPGQPALIWEETSFSYGELNRRANRLAQQLRALGVGAETLVAVCLDRTPALVVGVLAILKAGGAYVPLDPAYPPDRLAFIMADTKAPVLLTRRPVAARLGDSVAGQGGAQTIYVDEGGLVEATGQQEMALTENPPPVAAPGNLAYVIYTSGSTGRPKGVAITHGNVVALLDWAAGLFSAAELQGVLAATSICFDLSVYELFLPLARGGSIILAQDALQLAELPARERVTLINTVPSVMLELVRAGGIPATVRTVNLAGEPLKWALVQQICAQGPVERVYNLYGPSEDTTYSTYLLVERAVAGEPGIGQPLPGTQAYILDEHLEPVPIGVAGQLYLGGAGMARGYLNRPGLTAERFIPNPFYSREKPGLPLAGACLRLYRTGDLARYRPDGCIEFIGRIDHQVKVRGFRIELGEVEATLSQHPLVHDVVVVVQPDGHDGRQLVAYVVPEAGRQRSDAAQRLRQYLKLKLPDYMVPAAFMFLEALPLTPNGKLDRQALPLPDGARPAVAQTYAAPRTPVEGTLAGIWRKILGLTQIGVYDNFFELGGHSLLATRIASQVRQLFQVEIPLREFFTAPCIADLAERVTAFQQTDPGLQAGPILPGPRDGDVPLSFAQQRLWLLNQITPNNPAYQIPGAVQLLGPLNVQALQHCLEEIVRRHEALRTTFPTVEGNPVQRIHRDYYLELPVLDLAHLPAERREAAAREIAEAEAKRPFNLAEGPLLRMTLIRLGPDNHVLLMMMHHIICDGWSLVRVFVSEMAALYRAFADHQPSPLPELPIQYADYAIWQRKLFDSGFMAGQLAYWQEQLAGAAPVLPLPTDRPRPAVQTFNGAVQSLPLPPPLSQAFRKLCRQQAVTPFMAWLAAFQVLLYRYTGQADISVGTPIANRQRAEIEELIGFFANTLVLRTELSGNPSFRELLARVKEVALGAYAHQDFPFEQLVDSLQPERDMSRNPLFQVMFIMQNLPDEAVELPGSGLALRLWEIGNRSAKFDLTLSVEEVGDRLIPAFEYNTDLFDKATIANMLEHLQRVIEEFVTHSDRPIVNFSLLSDAEKEQALVAWNDTYQPDCLVEQCLHQLIEAQVARTPEATAVIYEGQRLSYQDLNRQANQLAHYLQKKGVRPETPVGVCLERSLEMVVALLAVLKAGGAYVPLDPDYPAERLAFMLADSQVPLLVTQSELLSRLPETPAGVLCLARDWPIIAGEPEDNPASPVTPDNTIYVIYTSGSTGKPKGAANVHRGLANRLLWMQKTYQLAGEDRVLLKTPFSFDVFGWEFFWPLLAGARLVVARPGGHKDSRYLVHLVNEEAITTLHFVPSLLRHFVAEPGVGKCGSLKRVICSGEALPYDLHERFFQQLPCAALHNLYGPTEAAIDVTFWHCQPGAERRTVPIGRPIANTQIYLLDRQFQPVPVGVAGELYIGGVGLARGYWRRPGLTAERFVPDPFGPPGGRLYKTGDLARYLADGAIEFLGRLDHQVKIRGFRIELGEIEFVLNQHPQVEAALVIAHGQEDARRLVAYIVVDQVAPPPVTELRHFLQARVPDYMVPAVFILLNEFPLLPNGKVNRRALPEPDGARPDLEQGYVAPLTPVEETLAGIWEQVLGIDRVGIYDNFFELGGDSLLAVRLMAHVMKQFQVDLPLAILFQGGTVERLARILEQQVSLAPPSPFVPIQPHGSKRPFFCVHPAGGQVLCYVALARRLGTEQPFYGLQASGLKFGAAEPLDADIETMAAHYIEAMRDVQPQGPYLIGGWSMGGTIAFEMARQLQSQGEEVAFLALLDTPARFTPENAGDVDEVEVLTNVARQYHIPLAANELDQVAPDQLLPYFIEQARAANIVPPDLSQLRHYLDVYKLHNRIVLDYTPAIFSGRITLFRASEGFSEERDGPALGWEQYSTQPLEIHPVPGDHGTMAFEPHVQVLAEQLRACLECVNHEGREAAEP
ncbi:MAG: amino acid adenylation domain-containing protein [Chloroflexi bacterium]|nr:amino acid adenylation domain-containing protein [Chloroflexota bacterium]MCI0578061.1 amino acid adenylation domain-containing protein [Chloroflexota bacterium]MCI0646049.1 amino acid adenylation domain-containing protein [Chloroflexota bacterium]MCI0732037.1 amino acid adenylation domain-containing protein [Chloroflexota bacterium]